jgi:hypothetical protein
MFLLIIPVGLMFIVGSILSVIKFISSYKSFIEKFDIKLELSNHKFSIIINF